MSRCIRREVKSKKCWRRVSSVQYPPASWF